MNDIEMVRRFLIVERAVERLTAMESAWVTTPGGLPINVSEGPDIDIIGPQIGRGGDTILLFDSSGEPLTEFQATEAGLVAALGDAASGDTVWLPSVTIAITAGVTVPAGAALVGMSDKSAISASGFSGTAITLSADAVCYRFGLTYVSDGTTAIGIDARFARANVTYVTVSVSGGSSINVAVELGAIADGPGTLSHYGTSPGVSYPDDKRYATSGMTSPPYWHGAGYRIQSALSLGLGQLRVTVYCEAGDSGDDAWALMSSNDSANTGVSPDTTPSLTGNTSVPGVPIVAGNSYVLLGTGGYTWATDGYFAIKHIHYHNGLIVRATKVEWGDGSPTTWHTLWEEGAILMDAPTVALCRLTAADTGASALACGMSVAGFSLYNILRGDVYDIDVAGTLYLCGNQYDHAKVNGTPVYQAGDRAAYSVEHWHASDIEADVLTRHLPLPGVAGTVPISDGSKWAAGTTVPTGSGIVGRIAEWVTDANTLQASTLIKTGTNALTLATGAAAATTWTIPVNAVGVFTNDGAGLMSWVAGGVAHTILSATHTDTLAAALVQGDMLYVNATPELTQLAEALTDHAFLKCNIGIGPNWSTSQLDIGLGDLTCIIGLGKRLTFTAADDINLTLTGGDTTLAFGATGRTYTFPDSAGTVALMGTANSGVFGIGVTATNVALDIGGTVTSAAAAFGVRMASLTLAPANANVAIFQYVGAGTIDTGVANTISVAAGLYAEVMQKSGTGTITNTYAIWAKTSSVGTNNFCAYFDGVVGIMMVPVAGRALSVSGYSWLGTLRCNGADTSNTIFQSAGALAITSNATALSLGSAASTAHLTLAATTGLTTLATTSASAGVLATLTLTNLGSAAIGDGGSIIMAGLTSVASQTMARIYWLWTDPTSASRKADLVLSAWDTAEREFLRGGASGSAPMIGFLGATRIVQPLATTDLGVVLSNLGLRVAGTAYPITTSGAVNLQGVTKLGDGATNYSQFDADGDLTQTGTARIDWTKKTAASVTLTAGTTPASVVADLQTEGDGLFYHIDEAAATPGIDLMVEFTGITAFNWVNILAWYDGSATHALAVQLYDWVSVAYKTFSAIQTGMGNVTTAGGYILDNIDFFVPSDANYIGTGGDAGKVRVRLYHTLGGNSLHNLDIDVVALYQ